MTLVTVRLAVLIFVTLGVVLLATRVEGCTAPSEARHPEILVARARVIVRAIAIGCVDPGPPPPDLRVHASEPIFCVVEFRVEEVLKGVAVPPKLRFRGMLSSHDDFNDRPVPYDLVRPSGRGGTCSTWNYKKGAQYLFFLNYQTGDEAIGSWDRLTPDWAPMAPTNEQLRSSQDAWVQWVKRQLKLRR